MKTFIESYKERIQRNHALLTELAKELKTLGCIVKVRKSDLNRSLLNSLDIYDKDLKNGVRLQFNEVPYRWTLEYDIKPSFKNGSSYTGEERQSEKEIPFTASELIGFFHPMYIDKRFENHYEIL